MGHISVDPIELFFSVVTKKKKKGKKLQLAAQQTQHLSCGQGTQSSTSLAH